MKTPQKHAALIHAWADGAEIEFQESDSCQWLPAKTPQWHDIYNYRIKPEPKPDQTRYTHVATRGSDAFSARQFSLDNLKLTFCGNTGFLKSAEVI